MRNEGARQLGRICEARTQAVVAAELGVTRQAVASWLSGMKGPNEKRRHEIAAKLGIHPDRWREAPMPPVTSPKPSPSRRARGPRTTPYERALAHLESVDAALAAFPQASPRELAALLNSRSAALRALGACETTWEKILDSDEWERIEAALLKALRPFPEAANACRQAMHELQVEAAAAGARVEFDDEVDDDAAQLPAHAGEP